MVTIWVSAFLFAAMGVVGLAAPRRLGTLVGMELDAVGRNEVRAVYGGYGIAMGVVLAVAAFGEGIVLVAGAALLGMAGGRIVSLLFERPAEIRRLLYFWGGEIVVGTALVLAG